MKKTTQIIILLLLSSNLFAQVAPNMRFRKPTTSDNITYRFRSVTSNVDAYISVIGSKDARVEEIDDSSMYHYAWNPHIRFTRNTSSTDSSYVQFRITFRNASNNALDTLDNVAMSVIDLDGSGLLGGYREMVQTSLPATPKGILGSSLNSILSLLNLTMISGPISYANTDTSNFAAMTQINYANINTYTLKVGVVGAVSRNTVRQFSFYFKGFNSMSVVLPIKLTDFTAQASNEVPVVKWTTTSEENANSFEVYRSLDGVNYTLAGVVDAKGGPQTISNYTFSDNALYGQSQSNVYYKLRMVDNNGDYNWSKIVHIGISTESSGITVSSVYPNPSHGILNVDFKSNSENDFTLEVIDMFGKVYQSINSIDFQNSSSVTLDINDLNNGIYFVRITENNGTTNTTKFIKN